MEKLILFPYNGNALEAVDCLAGQFELLGFIDDQKEKQGIQPNGDKVFSREALAQFPQAKILAVPGSASSYLQRKNIIAGLAVAPERWVTVIHPSARVSKRAQIGRNVLIMAGVVVTSNARIGDHVCILPNTVIHHDVVIEDFVIIGAKVVIAGFSKIEKNCYLGSGSNIINNVTIGENSLIGLGANVISSFPPNSKAVGNPARQI